MIWQFGNFDIFQRMPLVGMLILFNPIHINMRTDEKYKASPYEQNAKLVSENRPHKHQSFSTFSTNNARDIFLIFHHASKSSIMWLGCHDLSKMYLVI